MKKTLTCINCPLGCQITIETDTQQNILSIEGNLCKRGNAYAQTEMTNPMRTVTSTVRLGNASVEQLPVKTDRPIPKGKIRDCMILLKPVKINTPIRVGDIIVHGICGTGSNIIATRSIPARDS